MRRCQFDPINPIRVAENGRSSRFFARFYGETQQLHAAVEYIFPCHFEENRNIFSFVLLQYSVFLVRKYLMHECHVIYGHWK